MEKPRNKNVAAKDLDSHRETNSGGKAWQLGETGNDMPRIVGISDDAAGFKAGFDGDAVFDDDIDADFDDGISVEDSIDAEDSIHAADGMDVDDSGIHVDDSSIHADDSGIHVDDSGINADDSGIHVDDGMKVEDDSDDDADFEDVPWADLSKEESKDDSKDSSDDDSMLPELGTVELTFDESEVKRKKRAVVTQRSRMLRRSHHKVELMCQLFSLRLMNHVCMKEETLARCLSLTPVFAVERIAQHLVADRHGGGRREIRRDWASADLHYLLSSFQALRLKSRIKKNRRAEGSGSVEDGFCAFLETRVATRAWHQPMLLTGMLRALWFDARLCGGMAPAPLQLTVRESEELERNYSNRSYDCAELERNNNNCDQNHAELERNYNNRNQNHAGPRILPPERKWWLDPVPRYWCEVYDQVGEQWMSVNAYTGAIERPTQLAATGRTGKKCAYAYIVGANGDGTVRDVTRRYTRDFVNDTRALRVESSSDPVEHTWWARWLGRWEQTGDGARGEREAAELARRTERSAMPRRIADFARSPFYVLARNLSQHEAVFPADVVGTVRGEPVFLRANVRPVRSRMAWRRLGRVVGAGERPAKHVRPRAGTRAARQAIEAERAQGRDPVTELFGDWQTRQLEPPPVSHGRVPRNEYGRVDLFVPSMLPRGAAHVRSARARAVCARLGIDCADAVVRFEFRRGASTPVVDGVVVPSAELAAIEDALRADQRISDEQARAAREKRAVRRWRQLLVALRVRAEIDASFAARSARPSGVTFPGNKPSLLN